MANNNLDMDKLLNQVVNSANDIIMITEATPLDEPGPKIVYVNEAFEALTGYTKNEVIGKTPRILQGKETSPKTKAKIRTSLEKKEVVNETILNYDKNGRKYWLNMKIVPLYDENNNITHFAAIERDVTQIKNLENQLTKMATEDSLTKTLNRRAFYEIATHFFSDYKINKTPFSILILDIDDFKKINDQFGHLIGDEALYWLANNIKSILRKSDILARYGGEEFIMLLPGSDLDGSRQLALAVNRFFNTNSFKPANKNPLNITVSIGLACINEKDSSLEELINRADKLLYKAKETTKNTVIG